MAKSRYKPSEDPILQAFKEYWAIPLEELLHGYLKGEKRWDEIHPRLVYLLDTDKKILSAWKITLENKQKTKEGLTAKELCLLGCLAYHTEDYLNAHFYFNQVRGIDSVTEFYLGLMYRFGLEVDRNYDQALQHFQTAAQLGNTVALNSLGLMYENGFGIDADLEKAITYYRQAAELNNPSALNNLGVSYRCGIGVEKDLKLAIDYYEKSVILGNPFALDNLGTLYKREAGALNYAKSATYYRYANAREDLRELYVYHKRPEVVYHAAIVLRLPDELNKLALNNADIFDELLRDDDWNQIKDLLKPEVAEKVIERNKAYFAERQYLLEQEGSMPSGVSNIILSYTTTNQNLLQGVSKKTDEIRAREAKAQQDFLEKEAKIKQTILQKETERQKPLLDKWKKKREEALSQKEKERAKDSWLFAQPNPDTKKTSIKRLATEHKKLKK